MATVFGFDSLYVQYSDQYNMIVSICNMINLDVDFVSPSCIVPGGVWKCAQPAAPAASMFVRCLCRYSYGYYLLLVVPLIPFSIAGMLSGLAWVWLHKVKRLKIMGVRLGFMCMQQEQFEHYALSCVSTSIPFLGIIYNNVCLKGFGTTLSTHPSARKSSTRIQTHQAGMQAHLRAFR